MCFSNFWCASVCFSGVESQMQLRVWMSKAFSDAFRDVFKVGTILCWYCSSSLSFFQPLCYLYFFCARDLVGCGQDADTFFVFHIDYALIYLVVFAYFFLCYWAAISLRGFMMRWVKYWGTVAVLCGLLCSAVNGCPHKCSCSGSHVDCQGQGFRTVPKGIPRNAERL